MPRFFVVEEERWPWPQTTCRSPRRHTAAERLLGLETLLHAPAPLAVTAAPRPLANIILEDDAIFPPLLCAASRTAIHRLSLLEIDISITRDFYSWGAPESSGKIDFSDKRPGESLLRREDGPKVQNAETVTEQSIESMAAAAGSSQRRGL